MLYKTIKIKLNYIINFSIILINKQKNIFISWKIKTLI